MPKVSILCSTYNQEKFIRQALESFMAQKTNFEFEVLIYDDASTDGTVGIIQEFQKKYPKIIKPFFQKENQLSKGVLGIMRNFLFPRASGEYIALCEGDDFFMDENKLQRQVDFLDNHPDYALCFHPARVFFENNEKPDYLYPKEKDPHKFTVVALLKNNFIQTNSVMYRRQDYSELAKTNLMPGDWYSHLYHARFGKIGFIDKTMAAYRRHEKGVWWNAYKNPDEVLARYPVPYVTMCYELLKFYGNNREHKKIIYDRIAGIVCHLSEMDKKSGTNSVEAVLAEVPGLMGNFLLDRLEEIDRLNKIIQEKKAEINFVRSSKFWKLRSLYLRLFKRQRLVSSPLNRKKDG